MKTILNFVSMPLVGAALVMLIFTLATMESQAQNNWIRCKHIASGDIQRFPGMSCPWNWSPV